MEKAQTSAPVKLLFSRLRSLFVLHRIYHDTMFSRFELVSGTSLDVIFTAIERVRFVKFHGCSFAQILLAAWRVASICARTGQWLRYSKSSSWYNRGRLDCGE